MSCSRIEFFVPDTPRPAGSKTAGFRKDGTVFYRPASKHAGTWRASVRLFAVQAMKALDDFQMFEGPIILSTEFLLARPKSHYTSKGLLKASAPMYPCKDPDTTKLVRGVEDALNGLVWKDDNQVVDQHNKKRYTENTSGAWVAVIRKFETGQEDQS